MADLHMANSPGLSARLSWATPTGIIYISLQVAPTGMSFRELRGTYATGMQCKNFGSRRSNVCRTRFKETTHAQLEFQVGDCCGAFDFCLLRVFRTGLCGASAKRR